MTPKAILTVLILLFGITNVGAQIDPNRLYLNSATVISSDIKASATWYRKYMKFKMADYRPDGYALMTKGEFSIKFIQGQNTIKLHELNFANGKKFVNGIDKIGFAVNQFDSLELYFRRNEERFLEEPAHHKNLNCRTMIVEDPDGNKILFMDRPDHQKTYTVRPVFFCISSSDYITSLKWYKSKMGFVEMELKDDANIHYQNYLKRDDIILELVHLPYESLETTEFMPVERDLAAIDVVSFRLGTAKKVAFEMDNNGNKIVLKY